MTLTEAAALYVEQHGIEPVPCYSAKRFAEVVGDKLLADITEEDCRLYVHVAEQAGVSRWTIKGTLKDVRTVCRANSINLEVPTVKCDQSIPEPTPLSDISLIYDNSPHWLRQFLVVGHLTALRLDDVMTMQVRGFDRKAETLTWRASKTGHVQQWPVPSWAQRHLGLYGLGYKKANDYGQSKVRAAIAKACRAAGVKVTKPKNLRQRSLTEWSIANGMAGEIVHGSGLAGVMKHYVSPLAVLQNAVGRLRVPDSFVSPEDRERGEETLIHNYQQLDNDGRELLVHTSARLAGC
jgi:hypothetical protein